VSDRKRILLLSHCLDLGGTERQLTEVAKALDPARYDVRIGCFVPGGMRTAELTAAGIPIVTFPIHSFFSVGAIRQGLRLASYIRSQRIELVHAFDVPMDIFGVPSAKLGRSPVVLASQRAHRSLTDALRLRVLRWTDRMADAIVVNCEYIRRHLVADEHVPDARIRLCYNGLDANAFAFRERPIRERLTIGVVCALRPEKDLELLIRSFEQVSREVPSRLLIVGSGPMLERLKHVAGDGVEFGVEFIPGTNDVARWMHEIDIFVLPSKTEALSNSLMEAMACGCACVASDVGGNPELLGRNERGLLFVPGDLDSLSNALTTLLRDAEMRRHYASAARKFVEENLTIAASVTRMAGIYEEFLSRRHGR
jgi:L-malate glycosyltransferase